MTRPFLVLATLLLLAAEVSAAPAAPEAGEVGMAVGQTWSFIRGERRGSLSRRASLLASEQQRRRRENGDDRGNPKLYDRAPESGTHVNLPLRVRIVAFPRAPGSGSFRGDFGPHHFAFVGTRSFSSSNQCSTITMLAGVAF